ncbi:unnamed protein product [Scytosiphon promiscuus]
MNHAVGVMAATLSTFNRFETPNWRPRERLAGITQDCHVQAAAAPRTAAGLHPPHTYTVRTALLRVLASRPSSLAFLQPRLLLHGGRHAPLATSFRFAASIYLRAKHPLLYVAATTDTAGKRVLSRLFQPSTTHGHERPGHPERRQARALPLTPARTATMRVPLGTARTSEHDRQKLVGKGDRLLGLVLRHTPARHQWAQWLRLPLASAAHDGDAGAVEELLAAGADGKAGPRGSDGATLLHSAARGGSERAIRALLKAGSVPDVNQPTLVDSRECPLHIAAKLGHSGASSALVEAGASVNIRGQNGWTPLHLAARFGQIEVVMHLLREGADPEAQDVNGYRPLHYAAMWSHPATLKALIAAGASLEPPTRVDGTRPLHIAARYASSNIVRDLLLEGADKDARNSRGFTALHAAASSNKIGAISLLLAAGAGIDLPSGNQGFTPLHLAARKGAVEACSALLDAGASVRARTQDGSTPLHLACTLLKLSAVRVLLRHGADERALNDAGQAPVDVISGLYPPSSEGGTSHMTSGSGENKKNSNGSDSGSGGGGVGRGGQHSDLLIDEIRQRLASAPADRAWARRGLLIMARRRWKRQPCDDGGGGADRACRDHRRSGTQVWDDLEEGTDDGEAAGGGLGATDAPSCVGATAPAGRAVVIADGGGRSAAETGVTVSGGCGERDGEGDDRSSDPDLPQEAGAKRRRYAAAVPSPTAACVSDSDDCSTAVSAGAKSSLLVRVAGLEADGVFQCILSFL